MNKVVMIPIMLFLLNINGCVRNESLNNSSSSLTGASSTTNENIILNDLDINTAASEKEILSSTTMYLEEMTDENETNKNPSYLTELNLSAGKIETLEFNRQYLLTYNKKTCSLELNDHNILNQPSMIKFIINDKPYDILHSYDVIETAMCYVDLNGEYRIILSGKRGNDYDVMEIYKITATNAEKESQIAGKLIDIFNDEEIQVESRQFLIGFQTLTSIYKISNDGQMIPKEDFEIGDDSFLLVNDIEVEIYSPDISDYKKIKITAGERLTFYKTNMIDKLYFERDNGDKGYIEIKAMDTNEGFSVNGINLEDYFDGSELSWAG